MTFTDKERAAHRATAFQPLTLSAVFHAKPLVSLTDVEHPSYAAFNVIAGGWYGLIGVGGHCKKSTEPFQNGEPGVFSSAPLFHLNKPKVGTPGTSAVVLGGLAETTVVRLANTTTSF